MKPLEARQRWKQHSRLAAARPKSVPEQPGEREEKE
jgi:hypothetical protein